jgi:AraC-like DNA-binding protein
VNLLRVLRSCAGVDGEPPLVRFDFPRPSYAQRYGTLLAAEVQFSAPTCELELSLALAERPNLHHSPELTDNLCRIADATLHESASRTSVRTRVYRILCDAPQNHRMSMDDVASRLGLSSRSLRRRLHAEGNPYPGIALAALRFHAETLLRDRTRSVKEVAFTLGFRDPSAFHRAVRRCSGESPSELRSRLEHGAPSTTTSTSA